MSAARYKFMLIQAVFASALAVLPLPGIFAGAGEQQQLVLQNRQASSSLHLNVMAPSE